MGFDIKAAVDGIVAVVSQNYLLVLAGLVLLLLFGSNRIRDGIDKALTDNWQLTLLASTGIALSLASAYTTFDGLRNFTSAPLLSVFISFGIQGVMLIVAWLIGESFAVGMNQRAADGRRMRLVDASVGMLLGVAFVGLVFYWVLHQYNAVSLTSTGVKADMVTVRRRVGLLPALAGAAGDARLRLQARRRHLDALRAKRAPDRQECRAVGDVPGLHDGLGVLLLRLAFQRHLPGRGAQARRRDPHHQPDRRRRRRHRRADAEAADRGSRAAVRYRRLEGLRQAAGEPRPGRAGRAGRDREISSCSRWRSAAAPSPSSRSASPPRRADRPASPSRRSRWSRSCRG